MKKLILIVFSIFSSIAIASSSYRHGESIYFNNQEDDIGQGNSILFYNDGSFSNIYDTGGGNVVIFNSDGTFSTIYDNGAGNTVKFNNNGTFSTKYRY